jgi:hypothetical protein
MDLEGSAPWKPRLLALLDAALADQQAFVDGLSDDARQANGSVDGWAAKDHIAHLTAWKRQSARLLAAAVAGDTPPPGRSGW